LPDQGKQTFYDITPLRPLFEAGYVVLTPNSRLARSISTAWDRQQEDDGHRVWRPAKVAPLETWLHDQWRTAVRTGLLPPLVPVTPGQLLELWQEVIAAHERDSKGYSLLRPTAAAAQASSARETLLRWQVQVHQPRHRAEFALDEDCATFFAWQSLLVEKLASLELTTPGDALTSLLGCAEGLAPSRLALLGFGDMPPLLRACVDALGADVVELPAPSTPGNCLAYAYPDKRSELAAIAHWAQQLTRDDHTVRIGIILPAMSEDRPALEYLLRREFGALGTHYTGLPVNFSVGIPLDRVPLVRDALLVLALGRPRVAIDDVVAVFQSRFVILDDANSALAEQFLRALFNTGNEFIDAGDLRYRASQVKSAPTQTDSEHPRGLAIGALLMALAAKRELRQRALPSHWADRFAEILAMWGWPGKGPLDSIEYQQLQLWYSLLEEFAACDMVCGAMHFDEAAALLTRCCARQVSQPQTPDSNIQVLGLLEAAGLTFDHLWISDMRSSSWPPPARPNPFIPVRLQREREMPHASAAREWSFASGLMSQYVHCANEVIASYAQLHDGVPEKPSALVQDFQWVAPPPVELLDQAWLALRSNTPLECLEDNHAPLVQGGELEQLAGGSGLLEDQSHCPFRAFARRRLAVAPLGERSIALSAAERGSLLHDALYHLWGDIGDSVTLADMDGDAMAQVTAKAVSAAINAIRGHRRAGLGLAYFELEGKRLHSLLEEWLTVERQRSAFRVLAREEKISLQVGQLSISLRADRIDELPDGARFVIDYKSGRSNPQDWLGRRPSKPQLLLYGLAMEETVAGLAFAQVRRRDCKYTGAGQIEVAPGVQSDIQKWVKDKMPVKDWEDLTAQWRDNLERLSREFVAGEAQVDPLQESSCTYCGLQALCRIDESPRQEGTQ